MGEQPPSSRVSRTARVGKLAAGQGIRFTAGGAVDKLRSEEQARRAQSKRALRLADTLVDQLGHMKGAAMKLGQVLSTLDFPGLPEQDQAYLKNRLASLRDQVEPQPWPVTEAMLKEELQGELKEFFSEFDSQAFAAASIGQVYRAQTLEGKQVAVKVQYKDIDRAVETDLRNAVLLVPMLHKLAPGLDASALIAELRERVLEELDYELEADRTRQIHRMLKDHPFLITPAVHRQLSAQRVLTTDFIEGQSFAELLSEPQPVRDLAGEQIFRFFFGLLSYKHVALGDPHPGNFLRVGDKMAFVDFGMQRKVDPEYLRTEQRVAQAVIRADAPEVAVLLRQLGYLPEDQHFDEQLLLGQLRMAGGWYFTPGFQRLSSSQVSRLALEASSPDSPFMEQMRRQTIPPQALLIRRMESMLFSVLGEMEAGADWNALSLEYFDDGPPSNALGVEDQRFFA